MRPKCKFYRYFTLWHNNHNNNNNNFTGFSFSPSLHFQIVMSFPFISKNILILLKFQEICKAFAIALHLAYTCVFSWMLVEAIHLYRLLIIVYGSEKDLKRVYYAVGYGNYVMFIRCCVISLNVMKRYRSCIRVFGVPSLALNCGTILGSGLSSGSIGVFGYHCEAARSMCGH